MSGCPETKTQEINKGPFEVGDKLTVISWKYSAKAYRDQFGIAHAAHVLLEAIPITIKETKIVNGEYRAEDRYMGYRAESDDGREFICQWNRFDDASMDAYSNWLEPNAQDSGRILLHAADSVLNMGFPLVDENGESAAGKLPGIAYCEKHRHYYQTFDKNGCIYCYCKIPPKKKDE